MHFTLNRKLRFAAYYSRPKNLSSDLQGYVFAVKVDGLVFAACLAAEDIAFLFIKIISVFLIHLALESCKRSVWSSFCMWSLFVP